MVTKFIVANAIKRSVNEVNLRVSEKAIIDINSLVAKIVDKAARRAKKNGRKTIYPHDL